MRNIKFKENVWIHLNTNDNDELEKIYSDYDINLEVINYTLG